MKNDVVKPIVPPDPPEDTTIVFSQSIEDMLKHLKKNAMAIHGDCFNDYSNAIRREIVNTFVQVIEHFDTKNTNQEFNYLEIGSCRGMSMSIIASLIGLKFEKKMNLVSIDPYFIDGYEEGQSRRKDKSNRLIQIDKDTRNKTLKLWQAMNLEVRQIESTSQKILPELIKENRDYDLIYVDGHHEGLDPLIDIGNALSLLREGGVIMLDDYMWPDILPLKIIFDQYAVFKVHESWKIAAYRVANPNGLEVPS